MKTFTFNSNWWSSQLRGVVMMDDRVVAPEVNGIVPAKLEREGEFFVMTGVTGRHSLAIQATDAERLLTHWNGFVQQATSYAATMLQITEETRRIASEMTGRYFLIDSNGQLASRNEFGKASSYVFKQKSAAIHAGERRHLNVWDSHAARFLEIAKTRTSK